MSRLARLTPPTAARPNGYPKATLRAALVNSGWLLTSSGLGIAGAIDRLTPGTGAAQGLPILVGSILGGDIDEPDDDDNDGDLNVRAVLLDTPADAGVAVTGGIILATSGLYWLGPAVALAVSAVVAYHATRLLRRVTGALRPTGPPHPVSEADRESLAQPPPRAGRSPTGIRCPDGGPIAGGQELPIRPSTWPDGGSIRSAVVPSSPAPAAGGHRGGRLLRLPRSSPPTPWPATTPRFRSSSVPWSPCGLWRPSPW